MRAGLGITPQHGLGLSVLWLLVPGIVSAGWTVASTAVYLERQRRVQNLPCPACDGLHY